MILLEERFLPLTTTAKGLKISSLNNIFLETIQFLLFSKESLFIHLFIVTCSVFIEYHDIPKIPTVVGHLLGATTVQGGVHP